MRNKIEKFLFIKGFKPLKIRTQVMIEYMMLIINRDTKINESAIRVIAEKFEMPENNVIQHLYQFKKYYEKILNLKPNSITATDLAYALASEFTAKNAGGLND